MPPTGFWWILLSAAFYGVVHSVLASNTTKLWAETRFGSAAYRRYYRLFFSVMAVVTFLPTLALLILLPDAPLYRIPAPWVYLTLLIQAAALLGLAAGVLQTGLFRFVGLQQMIESGLPPRPEKLVVSGLYAWVRHPLYFFSLLLLWLTPVLTWNLLAVNIALSLYLLIGAYFFEEPKLVEQFGADYEAYRQRTPMILPFLRLPSRAKSRRPTPR